MDNNIQTISEKDLIKQLIEQKRIPEIGWKMTTIEYLLSYLSSMDSNNFANKASVGEREGRCFSNIVARRNFYFTHGIGRSGDLTESQPKAAGSSILYKLTNSLLDDLMTIYDIDLKCLLIPVPIGASLILCLSAYRLLRKSSQYVIWFREDDEVIFNAIINGGFVPIILIGKCSTDSTTLLQEKINEIGLEKIACIVSSIACMLPRMPDNIDKISKICKKYEIPHIIINNSGLQSKNIMNSIQKAHENGRIDLLLQNACENFMVPVGATLLASCHTNVIEKISKIYPGRASSSSVLDIVITLLSLGKKGYTKVLEEKEQNFQNFHEGLCKIAEKYKEYVTKVSSNSISLLVTFSHKITKLSAIKESIKLQIIKMDIIATKEKKVLSKYEFEGWRTHGHVCQSPFIVFQLPLGTSQEEINYVLQKIDVFLSTLPFS